MNNARRIGLAFGWIALGALFAVIAHGLLVTRFMIYDDEGYVLWSVRQFTDGQPLYRAVFSQYGPFFYAYYGALHALTGLPFDNETGRWLTLLYWVGAALLCGGMATRLTRSFVAGAAAAGFAFAILADMTCEPFHPGGLLAALTAVGAAVGLRFTEKRAPGAWIVCGLIGTAMALTKVNVGALFLIAAASWLLIYHRNTRTERAGVRLVAAGVLVAPMLLMHGHWPAPWVAIYILIFVCSGMALLANLRSLPLAGASFRIVRTAGITVVAMLALIGAIAVATGTALSTLWEAVVVAPLRHPGVYSFPVSWFAGAMPAALLAIALAGADWKWRKHVWRPHFVAALRLVAGGWFLLQAREADTGMLHRLTFQFGPTLAWLMATPLSPQAPDHAAPGRAWLAWLSLWQMLQAYPVGGTQQAWAAFTWAPLLIAGWWDAARFWSERVRFPRMIVIAAATIMLAAASSGVGQMARWAHLYYRLGEPLGLPGARTLRIQHDLTTSLRVLHRNIRAHGETLFSFPGMFSFNIWTDKPTPTAANVTHWFSLLDDAQQQAIADRLAADPAAVVVVHRIHVNYLINSGFAPQGLLKDYVLRSFQPAIRVGHYDLWVHRGRAIAPLATGTIDTYPDGRRYLNLVVSESPRAIASLQIRQLSPSHRVERTIVPDSAHPWHATAIDPAGRPHGQTRRHVQPFATIGLNHLQIPLESDVIFSNLAGVEILLVDNDDAPIEALRFNEAPGLTPAAAPPAAD